MTTFPDTVFAHPLSSRLGSVSVGEYSSLWPGASLRGDFSPIRVGRFTSIQDCCVLHATPTHRVSVGDFVTVGHGAVLHGCAVEDDCMIGMNSTVLDGAVIGRGSIVAAGALVREGTTVPPGSFVVGLPAEIKPGRPGQAERSRMGALSYAALAENYRAGHETISPEELLKKMGELREKAGP